MAKGYSARRGFSNGAGQAAQQMQMQQMAVQAAQQQAAAAVPRGGNPQGGGGLPQGLEQAVDERARRDALAAVQGGANQGISI